MNSGISFALPKGRLAQETVNLLADCGICERDVIDFDSRKLIFEDKKANIKFLLIRNSDVITYVNHGAADFGVVGKDVLLEDGRQTYEFYDLKFGGCRLSVASPKGYHTGYRHDMRVATKYPNIAKEMFAKKGILVEIIKLYGSIEIAPLTGISDYIVDLVDSGETLKKNGLEENEVLLYSSARLIANKSLTRLKHERAKQILSLLGQKLG